MKKNVHQRILPIIYLSQVPQRCARNVTITSHSDHEFNLSAERHHVLLGRLCRELGSWGRVVVVSLINYCRQTRRYLLVAEQIQQH